MLALEKQLRNVQVVAYWNCKFHTVADPAIETMVDTIQSKKPVKVFHIISRLFLETRQRLQSVVQREALPMTCRRLGVATWQWQGNTYLFSWHDSSYVL